MAHRGSSRRGRSKRPAPACRTEADSPLLDYDEEMQARDSKRREECLNIIRRLKEQFFILREHLYEERIKVLEEELQQIRDGTAKEWLDGVAKLEKEKADRIKLAETKKKFIAQSIQNKYEAEEMAARQDLENDKWMLLDSMREETEEEIRRVEHEKIVEELAREQRENCPGPSQRPEALDRLEPKGPPGIVFLLKEEEILEDLAIIRQGLARQASDQDSSS